ncbi:hypothetical protein GCM10011490_10670 [Pseudoclavibacter endophyticus]|uniref:CinA family protein n=1 Tax=Pseudoclavibacter endophyticus TaxID=1778590 RepID=UPI0019CEEBC8|nr:CinA family protein [Pseudoclavibacter endophyticus]GGA62131.1 hypothetical protein GCM10011490_10670 [Pseudoclavibacter endophyticus]
MSDLTNAQSPSEAADALAEEVGELARAHGFRVAAAESLTGGRLAQHFASIPQCVDWYAGAVVAYQSEAKYAALNVPRGPVVSEEAARAMAMGVATLMGADAAIAATGVGGPDREEGHPPGTTWLATYVRGEVRTRHYEFDGEPLEILAQTELAAVELLRDAMRDAGDSQEPHR